MGDGLEAAVLAQLPGGDQAIELPDRRFHIVGINLELGDALVALEADGGDAVLHREPFRVDIPLPVDRPARSVDHLLHPEILDARGALVGVCIIMPKNQKPVSATPMKSRPALRKRSADSAPKSRAGEVISSPPTNSKGPNRVSSWPVWNWVIGRAEISTVSTDAL